ncbi:MAG TPA: peptidoglycan bridge formation glycyltransferase FemA/FemB family protein [Anaerolineales bacterium]|nr:peptidoglycan bridge formation glycyltransferase FemA/FemB family protein [Anaerolineales bacterium]
MDRDLWNSIISKLPSPHFLQTHEWGQVKAKYGWSPLYVVWTSDGKLSVFEETDPCQLKTDHCLAAALILKRQMLNRGFARRFSILYSPKGPLLNWSDESRRNRVLDDLQAFARKQNAIFVKIDPDVVLGTGVPGKEGETREYNGQNVESDLRRRGWKYSSDQIQFSNTVLIDLNSSEEEILARMKQKTRYNIRLAAKRGVGLRIGNIEDSPMLYKMYAETSVRDGFVIRDEGYYQTVWKLFMAGNSSQFSDSPITTYQLPLAEPLIAQIDNEPVAAIFVFYFAGRAYYVYGMSRDKHREKMPSYLLQWEAMKRAKARGCLTYDLWGAPVVFDESDSMWGVYRFKEGMGGQVVRTIGAWDFAPSRVWYKLYSELIPRLLDVMRSRGKARTKQNLGA